MAAITFAVSFLMILGWKSGHNFVLVGEMLLRFSCLIWIKTPLSISKWTVISLKVFKLVSKP